MYNHGSDFVDFFAMLEALAQKETFHNDNPHTKFAKCILSSLTYFEVFNKINTIFGYIAS